MKGYVRKHGAISVLMFLLFMPVLTAAAASAADVEVSVVPAIVNASHGDTFIVEIRINPMGNEVYAAQFTLLFDNELLNATSLTNGTFLSSDGVETLVISEIDNERGIVEYAETVETLVISEIDNERGIVEYAETRSGDIGGVISFGVLAKITFSAKTGGICMMNISDGRIVRYDRTNDTYEPIDVEVLNGTVEVKPPSPLNISGHVFYENGSACEHPRVIVENMNTSAEWTADITSNKYMLNHMLNLSHGPDVLVGEVLMFNVTRGMFNITYHTVSADDLERGGFHLNITLRPRRKPDLVITDVWICCDNCTICYNITNIGDVKAHAGHKTALFVDFSAFAYDIVEELKSGESRIRCFDRTWTYTLKDDIMVCADHDAMIDERDEENNCISTIWKCGDVAPPYGYVTGFDVARLNSYVTGLCDISCMCSR